MKKRITPAIAPLLSAEMTVELSSGSVKYVEIDVAIPLKVLE